MQVQRRPANDDGTWQDLADTVELQWQAAHPDTAAGHCQDQCDLEFFLGRVSSKYEYKTDFRALKKRKCTTDHAVATDDDAADLLEGGLSHLKTKSKTTSVPGRQVPGLAPHLERNTHLLIQASYASKKSYRIRELFTNYLEKCDKPAGDVRILCFSVRIIHAHDQLAQLGREFGFKSYKDEVKEDPDVDLSKVKKLIISLESLRKLMRFSSSAVPKYDIVVVDEARSLVDVFSKEDTKNFGTSEFMFRSLLKDTPLCIFADADMGYDNAVPSLLRAITPHKGIHLLDVEKNVLQRHMKLYFGQESYQNSEGQTQRQRASTALELFYEQQVRPEIQAAIQKGEKVAFACASKSGHSNTIAQMCREEGLEAGVSYQTYNSKTSDYVKEEHFKDVDKAWRPLVATIATTSLTVAVDPRSTKFRKLFLFTKRSQFCGQMRDLFQQLGRYNRFLRDEVLEIICFVDDVHPRLLPLLRREEAQTRVKRALPAGTTEPPSFESCLGEVQDESDEKFAVWLRNNLRDCPEAWAMALAMKRQKLWINQCKA